MTVTHEDLNRLKDTQFEKLIKTLLLVVIGNGVIPFSQGKDGGREAKFSGTAPYPSLTDNWDGSWIFQVKFSDTTLGITQARATIRNSINRELEKLTQYEYLENNQCDNYIYITNVPFSGESKKGMHDYISERKITYKIKNFDYWDGEKVISLINKYPGIKESFFPVNGVESIDDQEFESINKIFVKPILYTLIKDKLLENKSISIIGQPHVGKTCLAKFLALEIKADLNLNSIYYINQIEKLSHTPKISNCVIIFDDIFGDLNYESIGQNTKILASLLNNNYIIVTSRGYIFEEAELKGQVLPEISDGIVLNQEGTYSDDDLRKILEKHLLEFFPINAENEQAREFVLRNSGRITRALRFPHNIHFFSTIVTPSTTTNHNLHKTIEKARKIKDVVVSWIKAQPLKNKHILLALAIGKFQTTSSIVEICKIQWRYSSDDVRNCISQNTRLVTLTNSVLRLTHPSYKDATLSYFLLFDKKELVSLVINLISDQAYTKKRLINRSLGYELLGELDSSTLKSLIGNNQLGKNYLEIAWLSLIRRNKYDSVDFFLSQRIDRLGVTSKYFSSFLATKSFMKDIEILDMIDTLFSCRSKSDSIDELIIHFSFGIKRKAMQVISRLNYNHDARDLKLKIKLFGVIGSKYPYVVLDKLLEDVNDERTEIREIVYKSLNMLGRFARMNILRAFENALLHETNKNNVQLIKRYIRNL